MGEYFSSRLAAGRQHLEKGHPTKAIEAFRQASYSPATAADAFNGMGVAYSMIGRDDVARDLFMRAIENDPADERFWRNLARADEQIMLAKKPAPPETAAALAARDASAEAELTNPAIPVQVEAPGPVQAKTLRTARAREVLIRTVSEDDPTSVSVAQRRGTITLTRSSARGGLKSSQYPIRIELAPSKTVAIATRRGRKTQSFPIRIALDTQ